MQKVSKITTYILIAIFALAILVSALLVNPSYVYAENTSVVIDLNDVSKFDAYNDVFAYTYNNSLYVVKDNTIFSYPNAFVGSCTGLEINATNILLLANNSGENKLYYYDYSGHGIKSATSKLGALGSSFSAIFSNTNGDFYLIRNFSLSQNQIKKFKENTAVADLEQVQLIDPSYAITSYAYIAATTSLYAVIDSKLYVANTGDPIAKDSSNEFTQITDITTATHLTSSIDAVIVNATSGIYKISIPTNDATLLTSTQNGSGEISAVTINEKQYIFTCEGKAITQYLYDGTSCSYYNKFNNSEYVHPITFDLQYVAKLDASSVNVYSSPRNMQITSTLNQNDYFLVLTKVTNEESGEYYYVVKADSTKGYIKSTEAFTKINPNTDVTSLTIGLYAQGLHKETNIYTSPYVGADVLAIVSIYDEIVVLSNVAQEEDTQVWNYYKVSYVKDGEIITGYVNKNDVSPYTSLTPPTVLKTVKISTESIGALVYLYALPSEESTQVAALTDGEELDLAEEYNKDSTWTKVVYKDNYAYVLTSQISQKGLTAVQITLIAVSSVVVVVSIIMGTIIAKRRKIGF